MENIEQAVKQLLKTDDGHGFDHVQRVRDLALRFASQENANINVVELASLLHDVDDYKLFGEENAKNLVNARKILNDNKIEEEVQTQVLDIIKTMGYSKLLDGVRPASLEGMIVSDADMCDAIGATGILRTHAYALSKGDDFFNKDLVFIEEVTSAEEYKAEKKSHSVQHFFDKLLRIPSLLMTESGREEGGHRKAIMVNFLEELFKEENAQNWQTYLDAFNKRSGSYKETHSLK